MRSLTIKVLAIVAMTAIFFGAAASTAVAQDYTIVVPAPGPDLDPTGDDVLVLINAIDLLNIAEEAADDAANGGGVAAAVKAQQAADDLADLVAEQKRTSAPFQLIERLEDLSRQANLAAAKANVAAGAAGTPAAPPLSLPSLAFTGSSASTPAAIGAGLVGLGGLVLLAARKREHAVT